MSEDVSKTPQKRKVGDGTPGPGRPKGTPNKVTQAAKDAIAQAAEELGGAKGLVTWAKADKQNERIFWGTIYPKLLPLQLHGSGPHGEHVFSRIAREVVDPK